MNWDTKTTEQKKREAGRAVRAAMPENAARALGRLEAAGFQACAVGGSVRDVILGLTPHDWDMTTSAEPEETESVFEGEQVIEIGMQHGTVTVVLDGEPLEITTFRVDGTYSDGRHPDQVSFTRSLEEDLARRDFTANAMAVGLDGVLRDPFGGFEDLEAGLLRCVGDPVKRFTEDALRPLRALRFAAARGLAIEPATAQAARGMLPAAAHTSAERRMTEFRKLVNGKWAPEVLRDFGEELSLALGETIHFSYGTGRMVFELLKEAEEGQRTEIVCAGLFRENTRETLRSLRFDKKTIEGAGLMADLVFGPDQGEEENIRKILKLVQQNGFDGAELALGAGMLLSGSEEKTEKIEYLQRILARLRRNGVTGAKDLALNGGDLIRMGVEKGKPIGDMQRLLLLAIARGEAENEEEALTAEIFRAMMHLSGPA